VGELVEDSVLVHDGLHRLGRAIATEGFQWRPIFRQRRIASDGARWCHARNAPALLRCTIAPRPSEAADGTPEFRN
jgi:hypothetical protein